MARARAHRSTLVDTQESPVSSRSLPRDYGRSPAKGKAKSTTLEVPLPRSRTSKLPEISVPSPRWTSDELVMPMLSLRGKVRQEVADTSQVQSMPVSSFREGLRPRPRHALSMDDDPRDQLDMLKLKDLVKHYRRCTTAEEDPGRSDRLWDERSDTKSTRAETEVSAEAEVQRSFAHVEIDFDEAFESIANISAIRRSEERRASDFDNFMPHLPHALGTLGF